MKKALEILCICCLFAASAPIPAGAPARGGRSAVFSRGFFRFFLHFPRASGRRRQKNLRNPLAKAKILC